MNEWVSRLTPGLLIAVAPAVVTIAYQAVQAGRRQRNATRSNRVQAVLEFTGQAWAIAFMLPFTQADAYERTKLSSSLSIVLRQMEPFDLRRFTDFYHAQFTALMRAASQIKAAEGLAMNGHVDEVINRTTDLFGVYLNTAEVPRSRVAQLMAPRPPLDQAKAHEAATKQADAIHALEAMLRRR